jgi:hypothetical protein
MTTTVTPRKGNPGFARGFLALWACSFVLGVKQRDLPAVFPSTKAAQSHRDTFPRRTNQERDIGHEILDNVNKSCSNISSYFYDKWMSDD